MTTRTLTRPELEAAITGALYRAWDADRAEHEVEAEVARRRVDELLDQWSAGA